MNRLLNLVLAAIAAAALAGWWIATHRTPTPAPAPITAPQPVALALAPPAPEPAPAPAPAAVPTSTDPHATLELLQKLRITKGQDRISSARRVIYHLESLAVAGTNSVPAIRQFLSEFRDVNYDPESPALDEPSPAAGDTNAAAIRKAKQDRARAMLTELTRGRGRIAFDFVVPPSLRLGLVEVLREIGGPGAEAALAEMLSQSGRAVEVAYVARILDDMAPGKYQQIALDAAKDLLLHPPSIEKPNHLDEASRSYLYGLLEHYKDASFAQSAGKLLVSPEGRLDRAALDYMTKALKEDSLPFLGSAFMDPRLTNITDRASIATLAIPAVGSRTEANTIFTQSVLDERIPLGLRVLALSSVDGTGQSAAQRDQLKDSQVVNSRLQVLESLKSNTQDPRLLDALNKSVRNLENIRQNGLPEPKRRPSATAPKN